MQEDIQNRSVVLATKTAKLTGRELAKLMRAALGKIRQPRDAPKSREGKQTVKQLAKGGSLQNIEIADDNIKAFEPYARKYGVSYALKKDVSVDPPRWLVFFRAKDVDALTAAFSQFSTKMLSLANERPSTIGAMQHIRELLKNAVHDKVKHKQREGPTL